MLAALTPGDVVTVTRIDHLARSTFDLFAIAVMGLKVLEMAGIARDPPSSGLLHLEFLRRASGWVEDA